jgi:myosin-crossreactive antigen
MITEQEKRKLIKDIKLVFIIAGGLITLAYAIYFIFDTLKKWY